MKRFIAPLIIVAAGLGLAGCYTDAAKAAKPNDVLICAPIRDGEPVYSESFTTSKAIADANNFGAQSNIICDALVTPQ